MNFLPKQPRYIKKAGCWVVTTWQAKIQKQNFFNTQKEAFEFYSKITKGGASQMDDEKKDQVEDQKEETEKTEDE